MTLPQTTAIHPDPAGIIVPRQHGQVLINPPLPVLKDVVRRAPAGSPWQSDHDTVRPALGAAWKDTARRAREELIHALAHHAAAAYRHPPAPHRTWPRFQALLPFLAGEGIPCQRPRDRSAAAVSVAIASAGNFRGWR